MNGISYEVSIFCSTHFYHPIANFPCEIKYNNNFKNVYPWIHYHDHIELFKIATLKKIYRRWLATSNDYFDCSGYIERIHPLHLRYRNVFCCYTILMDVFPWPPNQFDTSMGLFAIIGWSGSLFSKIGWLSQCFRLEFIHSCITCLLTPAKFSRSVSVICYSFHLCISRSSIECLFQLLNFLKPSFPCHHQ